MRDSLRIAAPCVAALALAGCGAPNLEQAPPPPMPAASEPAPPAPDLLGGAPRQPPAPPASPAPSVAPQPSATMQPIANPRDMTPEERHRIYGDRYASAAPVRPGGPAEHHRRRRSVGPLSQPAAASHSATANSAAIHGVPASAAEAIAGPNPRPTPVQPDASLNGAAPALLPASVSASANASAATPSSPAAGERVRPPAIGAPAKPQGKVIAASISILIALIVLIAAARNAMIGRPRRRPTDYGARG